MKKSALALMAIAAVALLMGQAASADVSDAELKSIQTPDVV